MQIIPIMPIETMYGMVNHRAGYYIRRSPTGKLFSCRCPDRCVRPTNVKRESNSGK